MRLEELHLERFGLFDGLRLDLSDQNVLLHIVHGPNEAGKSTALVAICDLLFGIPERTPYNFLHEYGRLRIGGTLSNAAGQRLTFKRRKARTNDLLKADESGELPQNCLMPFLGGITREFFERMFGLNHERLRAGGQAMLDAGGELARSLFEAGSGGPAMGKIAETLIADADAIGSPARKSGSKPYWRAHERYDQAIDLMRTEALKADAWNAALKALDEAITRRTALEDELAGYRSKRSALERVRRVAPILRRMDDVTAQLVALADGPVLPDGFEETWRRAVQTEQTARDNRDAQSQVLERLREDLEALGDPGPWPAVAERVEKVATGLGDYRTKRNDLPHQIRDLEIGSGQMADLIRQLGAAVDPERIAQNRPSEPAVARVRSLIAEWNRIDAALKSAREELEKAERAVRQAQADADDVGEPNNPAGAGVALATAISLGDTSPRLSKSELELQAAREELSVAMANLGRCELSADDLAKTSFPTSDVVVRFEQQLERIGADRRSTEDEFQTLQAELRRVDGDLEALRAGGEVPTVDALSAARGRRNHGWRLIRRRYIESAPVPENQLSEFAPDGDVTGVFETAVAAADQLADRREREAARIERFATLTGQRSKTLDNVKAVEERIRRLDSRKRDAELEWTAKWHSTGMIPGTPTEMRGWLARRDQALVRHEAVRKANQAVRAAEAENDQVRSDLLEAAHLLGLADVTELGTAALRDRVKTAFENADEQWDRFKQLSRALVDRFRESSERRRDLDSVNAQLDNWNARWIAEMPALGLSLTASTSEAEAALAVWQRIGVLEANLAQTRHRRDQLSDAVEAYKEEVRALVGDLGDAAADLDAEEDVSVLVPVLVRRLSEMSQLSARLIDARTNERKAEAALKTAEAAARNATAALRSLRDAHRLPEDADVVMLAQQSVRRKFLEASLEVERQTLAAQSDGHDEASLRLEILSVDADTAAGEVGRLETEIERLQGELQTAAQAVTVAEADLSAMRGRIGIAGAAQEANDAAADMLAHAERWLRLRAAAIILNRAVERYRAANQHPLVRRASEIFKAVAGIGENPIVQLSVDYTDEARPVLVGLRRDSSVCPVPGMSDGTADQLYLALRIAAIERYIEGAEPMPFIADDIFITSDENRTVPGVKALAELGRRSQVLLFTHHRYVIDAAMQALESHQLKVHALRTSAPQSLEIAR